MACTRITTGGRSWIAHDRHCPGNRELALCLFWIAEEEFKRKKHHHHGHHHPYGDPDDLEEGRDRQRECAEERGHERERERRDNREHERERREEELKPKRRH